MRYLRSAATTPRLSHKVPSLSGVGTTGMVALEGLRTYIGIELNPDTLDLSLRTRLRHGVLDLQAAEA